jgi:hypothetical protein
VLVAERRLVGQAKMGAAAALLWRRRLAMSGHVAPLVALGLPRLALMDGNGGRLGRTKGGRWVRRHAAQFAIRLNLEGAI